MRIAGLVVLICLAIGCVDLTRPAGLGVVTSPPPDAADASTTAADAGADTPAAGLPMDLAAATSDAPAFDDVATGGPDALLPAGRPCAQAAQCASGFCAQGLCCDARCDGVCVACNLPATPGQCLPVPAGEDPKEACNDSPPATCGQDGTCDGAGACRRYRVDTVCAPGGCSNGAEAAAGTCDGQGVCRPGASTPCASATCAGNTCGAACTTAVDCQKGFFCDHGHCALRLAVAAACSSDDQCASGFCSDGVCCGSRCSEICFACNGPGTAGSCQPAASGQDPHGQCPAEAPSTCGRAGGCNGAGACRLHPANTECVPTACSGGVEQSARTCDGLGVCRSIVFTRACQPYACTATACATTCASSNGCTPGNSCAGNACAPSPGLALFWRFDEGTGTTAADSSGNGRTGIYTGSAGAPTTSSTLPPLKHVNAASRAFDRASRHAVTIATLPAALKPANDFTVSVWYRATDVDVALGGNPYPLGAELVSAGSAYLLRLRAAAGGNPTMRVEFSKQIGNGTSFTVYGDTPSYLDGNWHHVAGVQSKTGGMRIYFDGVQIGASGNEFSDVVYSGAGPAFWVGRHGNGETQWDFSGNIDEVRVYTRPLSASEIATLARGENN